MPSKITRKVVDSGGTQNDAFDTFTTDTNTQNWSIGVDDSTQDFNIVTGTDIGSNKAISISKTKAISITGAAASSLTTSSGALTLEGAGGVDISATGVATTIKGTFNVDEAATFDTTVGVTGALTAGSAIIDNLTINSNTIEATSGAVNITPEAGSAIVLDGTINVDAGVVTGATSITSTSFVGALTGNADTATTVATVTGAAQTAITSLGTLTALTVDDVNIDGKIITMTGDGSDTAVITAGTNGALSIVTTDNGGAAANITITADGTSELAGTTVTLNASDGITLDADGGTITFADAGSSLGTITSSGYSGNAATATTAATVTGAAQTAITSLGTLTALTVDDVNIDGKIITMTGDGSDTAVITAGTNGALSIVTTDNGGAAANITITADGTSELAGTTVTLNASDGITLDADGGTITFADAGSSLGTITSSGYSGNAATATKITSITNSNIVQLAESQTLTNKTLTAPKIADDGFIADANGNQGLVLGTTSSAVNEIKISNAATGNGPTIAAQGDDTNVGLNLSSKGTGTITMNTSSLTVTSATSEKPLIQIKNTNSDAENATLRLIKDSTAPVDNDELGVIDFYGDDSAGNSQSFASITATSTAVASGSEQGKLDFKVATGNDGTEKSIMTIQGSVSNAVASTVTIEGNLDVKGTTTTINTTNQTINDNLIEINKGIDNGSNSNDSGILIDRGTTGDNGFMGWDESEDRFIVATTSSHGDVTGNLTIAAANLECAVLTATGISDIASLKLTSASVQTMTQSATQGQTFSSLGITYNDASTSGSGTSSTFISGNFIGAPTLTATNSSVTTTNAATLYISAAPTASTNQTITNGYALYVAAGTARFASMTTNEQVVTSDRKLKTNIITIDNSLEKVNKMRGVYFDWKDKEKYNNRKQIGFIAQEVEEVVPELVSNGDPGTKAVNYAQTVALLLEAVKEQNKIIEELRKDVEELKNNKN